MLTWRNCVACCLGSRIGGEANAEFDDANRNHAHADLVGRGAFAIPSRANPDCISRAAAAIGTAMSDQISTRALVTELETLLTVDRLGDGWYLGKRKPGGVGRVFGGQVIAQALAAAQDTVSPERIAHSLHAYFMRAGSEDYEITFRVERDFDGGSFSTRRIIALQQDKPILNMAASFQKLEEGLHHQDPMPDVPIARGTVPAKPNCAPNMRAMCPKKRAPISCATGL